jgi:hypothetical protein
MEKRDEYGRQVHAIIARGVAARCFVDCDPKLVTFAMLGAVSWIPRWFDPAGARSGKEIAETLSTYLVRGPSADPIAPAAG